MGAEEADGFLETGRCLVTEPGWVHVVLPLTLVTGRALGVGHSPGQGIGIGVRPGLLVRRPRTLHRLAGHLEVVDQLWPRPDGRAGPLLGGILDDLVEAWITGTVAR